MDFRLANYHAHTVRCQHAAPDSEEAYVLQAISSGYDILGFADHAAWPYKSGYVAKMRMRVDQLDDYVNTIRALEEKYAGQIKLHCGMECEAFPEFYPWLKEIKEEKGLDYFILGNHYNLTDEHNKDTKEGSNALASEPKHLFRYMETTIAGMESGLFAYLAHPDLCFHRYPKFDAAAKQVCRELCAAAKRLNMPLEYNFLGHRRNPVSKEKGYVGYCSPEFWEVAAEEGGLKAIIGVDAHAAADLDCVDRYLEIREKLTGMGITVMDVLPEVDG